MSLIRAGIVALVLAASTSGAAAQTLSGTVSPSTLHFTVTPAYGGSPASISGSQTMQVSVAYPAAYSSGCKSVESVSIYRQVTGVVPVAQLAFKSTAGANGLGTCGISNTTLSVTPFTASEIEACKSPISTTLFILLLHHVMPGDAAPGPVAGLVNSALSAAGLGAGSDVALATKNIPIEATVSCTPVHHATSTSSSLSPSAAANQNLTVTLTPPSLSFTSTSPGVIHGSQTAQLSARFPTPSSGCVSVERINVYRGMHTPQAVLIAQKDMPQSNGAGPCGIFGTVIPVSPFPTSQLANCGSPSTLINVALLHRNGASFDTVASRDVPVKAVVSCAATASESSASSSTHSALPPGTSSQHATLHGASAALATSRAPAHVASAAAASTPAASTPAASTPAASTAAASTVDVTPEQYSGTCPVAFAVRGTYTSTAAGPATSKWTFGDGGTTMRNITLFSGANTMTMPLRIQASHSTTITLEVTANGKTTTGSAPYIIQCK